MNILKSISGYQRNLDSRIHPLGRGKKIVLTASLVALSCFAFSPAWAGDYIYAKAPAAPIHLTSLSIIIGPWGFHLGIGAPSYGRAYPPSYVCAVPAPRPYWKQSRHLGHNYHHVAPQRFNRGHGWKNAGQRGHFRGNNGRGNGGIVEDTDKK